MRAHRFPSASHDVLAAVVLTTAAGLLAACGEPASTGGTVRLMPSPGPASPSVGAEYSLLIHCGVEYAIFDGASWVVDDPVPVVATVAIDPVTGARTSRNFLRGTMARLSASEAVFTSADEPRGLSLHFRIWRGAVPACA